ncbi:hypothetical protein [Oricola sp.]|uniref:hypothetical protein n=1 Tax=Oricola sp. TaxID=1979950 RepID=UPI003BAD453E
MLKQNLTVELESFVGEAISHLAAELRLVDLADYVAYLRMNHMSCIADIVRDASELFFTPGYVQFANDGDYVTEWGSQPEVTLMLVLCGPRTRTHVALKLCDDHAEVRLGYIDPVNGFERRDTHGALLADDIADNLLDYRRRPLPAASWLGEPGTDLPAPEA